MLQIIIRSACAAHCQGHLVAYAIRCNVQPHAAFANESHRQRTDHQHQRAKVNPPLTGRARGLQAAGLFNIHPCQFNQYRRAEITVLGQAIQRHAREFLMLLIPRQFGQLRLRARFLQTFPQCTFEQTHD